MNQPQSYDDLTGLEIAVVGMAGRFPGAENIDAFWQNLCQGVEAISLFTDAELAEHVSPQVLNDPHYVKARGILRDVKGFDASLFGFSPREAEITDPQQRLFLECAWEALEHAGYTSETCAGLIGVYAGLSMNTYLLNNLLTNQEVLQMVGSYQIMIRNDKDYLATLASYKLNLQGPSVVIQTACSTSLVAIHMACQGLLSGNCDLALAGGVSIILPQQSGHVYQQGGIMSPDGHCRTFDAQAQGTVAGNGLGIVVLKRLENALADHDSIHAIIKGSAINNDGAHKIGYTAPSIEGQAKAIHDAQLMADIEPDSISYVEAHGTATPLGDPIEIAALTQAFRLGTDAKGYCAIGSVKSNIGHLDAAAGVAGLIKTILSLKHQQLPPNLHFKEANPKINFADSPFYVNTRLSEWRSDGGPRRAGVSSFGIGGTNAHVVLEEAPPTSTTSSARTWHLLILSAATASALDSVMTNLVSHLKQHPAQPLADVAFTLQVGRKSLNYRRMLVCSDRDDLLRVLETRDPKRLLGSFQEPVHRPVVFMFPGQGAQYINMALEIYQSEPHFRRWVDTCSTYLQSQLGLDLRDVLYPADHDQAGTARPVNFSLDQTWLTQPALFVIEYALAQQWIAWGVHPQALVGHSIGEYVAACLAGLFSLEQALDLVAARGKLIQQLPTGVMLSVALPEADIIPLLDEQLSLAAVNAPALCVVAGNAMAIGRLEQTLAVRGVESRRLHTSHAFHSHMVEPALQAFREHLRRIDFKEPQIPFLSNVSGTWITASEATSPDYWLRHLRQTLRFADNVQALLEKPGWLLLEVGPGQVLTSLVNRQREPGSTTVLCTSLPAANDPQPTSAFLLSALGRLWLAGAAINWTQIYADEERQRVPLPTYPFEHQEYWVEPQATRRDAPRVAQLFVPFWKPSALPAPAQPAAKPLRWLVFKGEDHLSAELTDHLERAGHQVTVVQSGADFTRHSEHLYRIDAGRPTHYTALLAALHSDGRTPDRVLYGWAMPDRSYEPSGSARIDPIQLRATSNLLTLAQVLADQPVDTQLPIWTLTATTQAITDEPALDQAHATILGAGRAITAAYAHLPCCTLDVMLPPVGTAQANRLVMQVLAELSSSPTETVLAYRRQLRWVQRFESIPEQPGLYNSLRERGVYLLFDGLSDHALPLAESIAQTVQTWLIFVEADGFPRSADWQQWLTTHAATDQISRKIQRAQQLEAAGAQVVVLTADRTNPDALRSVINEIGTRFDALHGILYSTGEAVAPQGDTAAIGSAMAAVSRQIRELLLLDELVAGYTLDFCLMHVAHAAIQGRTLDVDTISSSWLTAFIHERNRAQRMPWTLVYWDRLSDQDRADSMPRLATGTALDIVRRIQALGPVTQIIVSSEDPESRDRRQQRSTVPDQSSTESSTGARSHTRPNLPTMYVAPSIALEQTLVEIWQELLGIHPIGVHDSFFELGGHSLLATQVMARVRHATGIDLPLRMIFEAPTVAELAQRITLPTAAASATVPLVPVTLDQPLPLSFAQERLWLLDQIDPGNAHYNMFIAVRLLRTLNRTALEQGLTTIIERHAVLRTKFVMHDEQTRQIILPPLPADLPLLDLSDRPPGEREREVLRQAALEAQTPFDLGEGRLIRTCLLRLDAHEHVLFVNMHHIVCDAWSHEIFLRELAALYSGFARNNPITLSPLPIQYADFAVWQRQRLDGDEFERLVAYWRQQLAGAPTRVLLPTDRPRPAVQTFRGGMQSFQLDPELTQQLRQFQISQQEPTTLFMTLLAAFNLLISRLSGQDDIVIGTDIANRTALATEALIGFFVNLLPLRTRLSGNPTVQQLLANVRETALGAFAHQDLPFAKLVDTLRISRSLEHTPLVQVLFVLQNVPTAVVELPNLTIRPIEFDHGMVRFELVLFMYETERGLLGMWNYNTDLFDPATITRMSRQFETVLKGLVDNPTARIGQISLLADTERRQQTMQHKDRKQSRMKSFATVTPKMVELSQEQLIQTNFINAEQMPLVIQPSSDGIDLTEWAKNNQEFIEASLLKHGALLFRGFGLTSAEQFEQFAQAITPELFGEYGDLPRAGVGGNVYTSTPYPPDKSIMFHNESSHVQRWPLKQWFFCVVPSLEGGATPIVDCRKVYQQLRPELRERFATKGLMYMRNYTQGLDVNWRNFFHTDDRAVVEEYLRQNDIDFEWKDGDELRTREQRCAVARHPKTGEMVFFNQIQVHHIACLDQAVQDSLYTLYKEQDLPRNVYYGDGTPIEKEVIQEIVELYERLAVRFSWEAGDIIMLDNMLVAHGRDPFVGPRKIVVAMGDMISAADL